MSVEERVAHLRAFNRLYTEVLGLLAEGLLDTPYSLPESRVLFELGSGGAASPSVLAERLRLDLGYVSRLLASLRRRGLVTRTTSKEDRRRKVVSLTREGRRAFQGLDGKSSAQIRRLLDRLSEDGQERLVACTKEIDGLLGGKKARAIVLREPHSGDFGWVVQRHGDLYRSEYGWDETFEALVARIVADYIENRDPVREAAWIAEVNGQRVGCVFCMKKDEDVAQLRILLVEPATRGMGIGTRLVEECIRFARRAGYKQMMLWTNDVLVSARRIYEAAGFRMVEEEKHRSFGHDLVGQNWYLEL
ncbi:MAG: bifunctional helix-turn-helix transcriptional regulator/GNAT family N-acetyltransferase [Actinomycetota bacterium]|nr:bifunctional helix-turn-helix transcriptional regulator/GNAT family N-acetyltransferase [Actinomycetota bacterium]